MTALSSGRAPARLWLARHGETADNRAGDRFQGFRDTPLNDRGRAQADALGRRLAADPDRRFASLWCSDLARARETAEIVSAHIGLHPVLEPRLREGNRGEWEGRRFREVAVEAPQRYAAWLAADPDFRFPGGESLGEHQQRVLAALDDIRRAGSGPALVVCHRGSIRLVLCAADPRGIAAFHDHDVANAGLVEV
ncbi:histidine phosphatase family protein [Conexibacter sp. DBS9H8]|uniref:histidine phosphatase family protein n=1 Tax=Conexibacter sp. DBS9H8 TaxID=2937801 RepID=UPI002010B898|nr:histidine phosphatase family protein [Conexibacter sp. DBS9H8]